MANELFENPKVALGFAGVVVAIALVASVAFEEFGPSDEVAVGPIITEETTPAPAPITANPSHTASAEAGWSDADAVSDDWGAPIASNPSGGIAEMPAQTINPGAGSPQVSQPITGQPNSRPGSPMITTSAAPGAPPVQPPTSAPAQEIVSVGS